MVGQSAHRVVLCVVLALLSFANWNAAVADVSDAPTTDCGQVGALTVDQAIDALLKNRAGGNALRNLKEATRTDTPLSVPSAVQEGAPSSATGGSVADGADIPWLAALGLGSDLVEAEENTLTISLNAFAFLSAVRPDYVSDEQKYESMSGLRRFGGSVTLGGKGERVDQDGDGDLDEPLEAKHRRDIVDWEVEYRLFGSRDRREQMERILRDPREGAYLTSLLNNALDSEAELRLLLGSGALEVGRFDVSDGSGVCYLPATLDEAFSSPAAKRLIGSALAQGETLRSQLVRRYQEIDRSLIVTLVVGGVEREAQFGRRERKAALRASFDGLSGTGSANHSLNVEWKRKDSRGAMFDEETWKLAYEYSQTVLVGSPLAKNGVDLALSAAFERFLHRPDAVHDSTAVANARLEFPLAPGVAFPISVTWANHEDLLSEESEVRGHIGFTIDLSKVRDALKSAAGGG